MPLGKGTFSFLDPKKGRPWQDRRGHLVQPLHFTEERMTTRSFRSAQRHTTEPRWEPETRIPRGGGQSSTFYSLFFNKWISSHVFMFGNNTAAVSTKHPMAIMNNCHFFLMFIYFWDRETEHERGRVRERGRHRMWSRLQALSCQHRADAGLEPITVRSWPEPKSEAQPTEPPRHSWKFVFK